MATFPPHEMLAAEFAESSSAIDQLARATRDGLLPPLYHEHPWVQASTDNEPVHPIFLYMDGVSYSRFDTVLGVFVYFLLTGKRHLVASVRKAEYCSCGCKGWCTIQPLTEMLAWSLAAMGTGRFPCNRHDGKAWVDEEDAVRQALASTPLGVQGGVCVCEG